MRWHDLLFAHWPMPAEALRPLVPPALDLDTFDGTAWLGIVPFRMTRVRPFAVPLPGDAVAYAEVNVRTYVTGPDGGRGVWFLSLDGEHRAGALAARAAFGIEYRFARVRLRRDGDTVRFESRRDGPHARALRATYVPTGPAAHAPPGSLDAFLTDRLCLYGVRAGRLLRGDIEHAAWPLRPADASIETNTMATAFGLVLPDVAPVLHLADRLDVLAHRPVVVGRAAG
jgi:hypothetical protein